MKTPSIFVSGLALFSMFFGAGNVIFPFILGEHAGDSVPFAVIGFLIAGVAVPFLGLVAMMMYGGNYRDFFSRIGQKPGFWLFALLIALLGPVGSIPRLITVSYATMQPYLGGMNLTLFSLLACSISFAFALRGIGVINILGFILTPILLISLGIIITSGIMHPTALLDGQSGWSSFGEGMHWGYSLLDLVAAFLYSTLVLENFRKGGGNITKKMALASILAATLLCIVYTGLTYAGAYYAKGGAPEEVVRSVCLQLLGPFGGLVACTAVGLACLTTAISLTVVCSQFLRKEILKDKNLLPIFIVLGVSFLFSNLGFMGIARIIGPILDILHPPLILLCLANIVLYSFRVRLRQAR